MNNGAETTFSGSAALFLFKPVKLRSCPWCWRLWLQCADSKQNCHLFALWLETSQTKDLFRDLSMTCRVPSNVTPFLNSYSTVYSKLLFQLSWSRGLLHNITLLWLKTTILTMHSCHSTPTAAWFLYVVVCCFYKSGPRLFCVVMGLFVLIKRVLWFWCCQSGLSDSMTSVH